jgi:hypothetical protein
MPKARARNDDAEIPEALRRLVRDHQTVVDVHTWVAPSIAQSGTEGRRDETPTAFTVEATHFQREWLPTGYQIRRTGTHSHPNVDRTLVTVAQAPVRASAPPTG